ncbi:MAG: YcaO-like family protein [Candidatus Portnoybacteria bacterium]|nr:YcaO-like family protein [Candidatus Portnoybacteria bacterium]
MGSSFDPEEARAKAVGEFLERYALLPPSQNAMEKASPTYLKKKNKKFLDPASVAGAFQQQAKTSSSRVEDAEFLWVKGKSLFGRKEIFLPAQLAFWHYNPDKFSEPCIRESNSNGAAGMFSLDQAILAGIYELIQRDAFLIFWLNRIAPPRITLESIQNEEIQQILATIRRYNLGVEILDITSDFGVPAFIAILLDGMGDKKRVVIGGGCDAKSEKAIKSSLMETLSLLHFARKNNEVFTLPEPYQPFKENIGQRERLLLWANHEMFGRFKWFISGEMMSFARHKAKYQIPFGIHEELTFLIEMCKMMGHGYEIYYYEANNSILQKLNYYAVQVIVPALVPLYLHETYAPLGASRLKTVPPHIGYATTSFPELLPHPFP